ncbi:YaaL family protein [Sporolactobacillus shoreicorticis]|uniref:YaaL family protein n=1 Tax=Sporolactobacillus shoreicorticis TaxID=1923877 RepID=A0ABW5S6K6_9BACL|nr:YaaL family protein [Sporolactobacillus shoreicorticis]MCO7128342.1 YaaL family protein [Sporolactobacillus shoreicorticis]
MFGRKKGVLRKEINESLLGLLEQCKTEWMTKKKVIDASIDPSDEVMHQLKLAEAKYFYLLKEIRAQKHFINK